MITEDYLTGWGMGLNVALSERTSTCYPPSVLVAMNLEQRRGFREGKSAGDDLRKALLNA